MTEDEFAIEARRVATAFGVPLAIPAEKGRLPHESVRITYALFKMKDFTLDVSFHEIKSDWSFEIFKDKNYIESTGSIDDPSIHWDGDPSDFRPIMDKALYLLGYDVESWLGQSISAHEKLEWQLEFRRRLREETARTK